MSASEAIDKVRDIVKRRLCPEFHEIYDYQYEKVKGRRVVGVYIRLGPYKQRATYIYLDIHDQPIIGSHQKNRIKSIGTQLYGILRKHKFHGLVLWIMEVVPQNISVDKVLRLDLEYLMKDTFMKYRTKLLSRLPSEDKDRKQIISYLAHLIGHPFTREELKNIIAELYVIADVFSINKLTIEHVHKATKIYAVILKTLYERLKQDPPDELIQLLKRLRTTNVDTAEYDSLLPGHTSKHGLNVPEILVLLTLFIRGSKLIEKMESSGSKYFP